MKKLMLTALSMLLAATVFAAPKAADYSGSWTLDKAKTEGLPKYYENIERHDLVITQADGALKVAVSIKRTDGVVDGFELPYKLGSDVKTESNIRTPNGLVPVPTTLTASVRENGELDIVIVREIPMRGEVMKGTIVERWTLSEDGKTLTIDLEDKNPRMPRKSLMVFVKQA